jgi:hypothetical protein
MDLAAHQFSNELITIRIGLVARICRSQSSKDDQFRQGRGSIPRFGIKLFFCWLLPLASSWGSMLYGFSFSSFFLLALRGWPTREPFCCLVTTRTKVRSLAQPCDYGSLRFGMDPLVILCEHRFCSFSGSSCWKRTPTLQQPTHQLPRPGSLFFRRRICRRLHHKHRLCPTQPYMYSTHVPQG